MIKVLSHFAHASYQTALSEIPEVEFYHVVDSTGIWPADKKPKNAWPGKESQPANIFSIEAADVDPQDFDLVLIHWHPFIDTFSTLWGKDLPVIFLEHTWPYKNFAGEVNHWKNVRHEFIDYTVYITESSKEAWAEKNNHETARAIYHSINMDAFPQKLSYTGTSIMTTTNEFIARDWACGFSVWAAVLGINGRPYFPKDAIQLYGYGNDAVKPYARGCRGREEILNLLVNAGVYFNPSQMSPIPMSLLEAAAIGTPIVSTTKCEVGRLFKDGVHGIISDSVSDLREGIKAIIGDPDFAKGLADNAKDLVRGTFTPLRFQQEWLEVFQHVKSLK